MKKILFLSFVFFSLTVRAEILVSFTPQGFMQGGPGPWDENSAPNTIATLAGVVLTTGLERGPGVVPGGTAEAWGGSGWTASEKDSALAEEDWFIFTMAPKDGQAVSYSQINATFFRGENSATTYLWQYQIGSEDFVDLGQPVTVTAVNVKGIPQDAVDLSSVADLQNVTQPVTFRMLGWGATSKGASWGFGKTTGSPVLTVEGTTNPIP